MWGLRVPNDNGRLKIMKDIEIQEKFIELRVQDGTLIPMFPGIVKGRQTIRGNSQPQTVRDDNDGNETR